MFVIRIQQPILSTRASELINAYTGFAAVPLALVGLVIPILALAINITYSKMGYSAIRRAFHRYKIVQLISASLFILGLETTGRFLLHGTIPPDNSQFILSPYTDTMLLVGWWWTISLIALAFYRVRQVLRSFDPQIAFENLTDELLEYSMNSLRTEMIRNVSINSIERQLEGTGFTVSYFSPERGTLFVAKKVGLITNINLLALRITGWLMRTLLRSQDVQIQLASPFHFVESRDLQLASTLMELTIPQHRALQRLLRGAFTIKRLPEGRDPLLRITQEYKESLSNFVRQDSEVMLGLALDGYSRLFDEYMKLGVRLRSTDHPGLFSDWRPIMLALHDLSDAIQLAVSDPDSDSPGAIAHWIMERLRECADANEEYLFSRLLDLFRTMFYYAAKSNHTVALDRSYSQPLHIFDYQLFRFGKTESISFPVVEARCRMAMLVIDHLFALLRTALDLKEQALVDKLLRITTTDELFAHFHPDIPFKRYEIEFRLKSDSLLESQRTELEQQLKIAQAVHDFEFAYPSYRRDTVHMAAEYLLQRLSYRASSHQDILLLFELLLKQMGDWNATQDWFENRPAQEDSRIQRHWEYWPDTRRGFSSSPFAIAQELFTIRALKYQSVSDIPLIFRATRAIDSAADNIIKLAAELLSNNEWRWATGSISDQTITLLRQGLDDARRHYTDQVRLSIRTASLDEDAIKNFYETARKQFLDDRVVISMLAAKQRLMVPDNRHPDTNTVTLRAIGIKEAFIKQDRIAYLGRGENEGRELARLVDNQAIKMMLQPMSSVSRIQVTNNAFSTLDSAIQRLTTAFDERPDMILLPKTLEIDLNLWDNADFMPAWRLGRPITGFSGLYREISTFTFLSKAPSGILIGYSRNLMAGEVTPFASQIALLDDHQRQKILKAQPNTDLASLDEFVAIQCSYEFNFTVQNPQAFLWISIPPDSTKDPQISSPEDPAQTSEPEA